MRRFLGGMVLGLVFMASGIAILVVLFPLGIRSDTGNKGVEGAEVTIPEIGTSADAMTQPDTAPAAPGIDVATDTPATPTAGVAAPSASDAATAPDVAATPSDQPIAADIGAGLDAAPTENGATPDVSLETETAPVATPPAAQVDEPAAQMAPAAATTPTSLPRVTTQIPVATAPKPGASIEIAPVAESGPSPEPLPQKEAAPQPAVTPQANTVPAAAPQIAALPQAGAETGELRPTIGSRIVPLTERNQAAPQAENTEVAATHTTATPLTQFASTFDNPDGKPLMAIVLIDDNMSLGAEALQDFPYPLTFAIDPTATNAAEKMARHRAAGFEVLALVNLPEMAAAQDAEVALAASFDTLNQAVGLLEGTGTGIQGNRGLSDQVTAFVNATGRGMITQSNGLNTAHKLAARNGVSAAVVFRDFDGDGQTPLVMRRFLDQAAFRANQDGGVIMMGRVRPDTISALLLWGLQDRANRVALAPVSAVLPH